MKKNIKKGFALSLELIILLAVTIGLACTILYSTKNNLKKNAENTMTPKLAQDIWGTDVKTTTT